MHIDPIETARRILAGELLENDKTETEEVIEDDSILEDFDLESILEGDDEDDEDEEDEEDEVKEDSDDEDDDDDDDEEDDDDDYKNMKKEGSETKTLDTKSEEDPNLYKDATGKGAKIDTDRGTEGKVGKNKAGIKGKAKGKKDSKLVIPATEHIEVMFRGENLSEDFKNKVTIIFETAVNERVGAIEEELQEVYESKLKKGISIVSSDLAEQLDDYLGYVAEQWMEENKLEVENGIRADVAENFLVGLKGLFEANYVDVPDKKYDILGDYSNKIEELEESLEQEIRNNIDLRKDVLGGKCEEMFTECSSGLTDIEVEKLRTLSEGIEFDNEEQYQDKLNVIKESYFSSEGSSTFDFEGDKEESADVSNSMQAYMSTLGRTMKNARDNHVS